MCIVVSGSYSRKSKLILSEYRDLCTNVYKCSHSIVKICQNVPNIGRLSLERSKVYFNVLANYIYCCVYILVCF